LEAGRIEVALEPLDCPLHLRPVGAGDEVDGLQIRHAVTLVIPCDIHFSKGGQMTKASSSRAQRLAIAVVAMTAALAFSTPASAVRELFFEETAEAFWAVPHQCADGSVVQ